MTDKKTLMVLTLAVLVVLAVFSCFMFFSPLTKNKIQETPVAQPTVQNQPKESLPKATGNIDDTVNALLLEASADETLAAEEDLDNELATIDDSEINNFGQFYDDNEL